VLRKVIRPTRKSAFRASLPVLMDCRLRFTKPIVLGSIPSGEAVIELPVSLDCERRSSKPIRSGSIPDREATSSLSRWIASIGLLNRLPWSDSKQGGNASPRPAGLQASVSEADRTSAARASLARSIRLQLPAIRSLCPVGARASVSEADRSWFDSRQRGQKIFGVCACAGTQDWQ
jgi:hypothetical protein